MPLFVATTRIGDMSFSKALFKNEKHSMSSMCTSSMNKTPGTMSALPSSRHSATLESICSLTSCLISPVSPANKARNPCSNHKKWLCTASDAHQCHVLMTCCIHGSNVLHLCQQCVSIPRTHHLLESGRSKNCMVCRNITKLIALHTPVFCY